MMLLEAILLTIGFTAGGMALGIATSMFIQWAEGTWSETA